MSFSMKHPRIGKIEWRLLFLLSISISLEIALPTPKPWTLKSVWTILQSADQHKEKVVCHIMQAFCLRVVMELFYILFDIYMIGRESV